MKPFRKTEFFYGRSERDIEIFIDSSKEWEVGDPVEFRINGVVIPGQGRVTRVSHSAAYGKNVTASIPVSVEARRGTVD